MRRMNFRQRIAWLIVAFYLIGTCALVYYIFEISDRFNQAALDHTEKYHKSKVIDADNGESSESGLFSVFTHITDIPLAVWLLLLVFPYLQVFSMLLACTKPEPRISMAYLWPFVIYIKCKQLFVPTPESTLGKSNVPLLQSVTSHPQRNGVPVTT